MVTRLSLDFTQKVCLLEIVKLTKNVDQINHSYSRYGIGFDSRSLFLFLNFDWGKNVVIFGVDNSSLVIMIIRKKIH